ncbi:hypothetical protein JYT30_01010 [Desulfotalea psychrophila]|uniref:Glycosyl transferase family 1 domain-containing protein n=1 Tax=Desulfotalea psychrophila TaxID=84980 RepID=A0ABS3ATE2_9BACT|nr:hypothetical protein [Desulfotalea psychrophila]MBN4071722.1 hypothetical protein [Desulfotalea psychrophila]
MSYGLPVVVPEVGGFPEIVKDGEQGFLIKGARRRNTLIVYWSWLLTQDYGCKWLGLPGRGWWISFPGSQWLRHILMYTLQFNEIDRLLFLVKLAIYWPPVVGFPGIVKNGEQGC